MRNKTYILLILVCSLIAGCSSNTRQEQQQSNHRASQLAADEKSKPLLVIIIDSLMEKPLLEAIQQKRAPNLEYLIQNGELISNVVSSFPTMSVTIDSTLLTGTYADNHHVPGLVWYNNNEKRVVYYGNGVKEAFKIDQFQVALDAVYQLNQVQLNKDAKTIHEELAQRGQKSASINAIVYRGNTEHLLTWPRFVQLTDRLPDQIKITGPRWFSYGALTQIDPDNKRNTRVWKQLGMNNDFSAQDIAWLVRREQLPDVTIGYFPNNDTAVHRKGPDELDGIEKADQALQVVMDAFGSREKALQQAKWIILGDSSQSYVYDDKQTASIELLPLLSPYRIAKIDQPVTPEDQIVITTNERMAYVYAIDDRVVLSDLVKLLQQEERLDMIALKKEQGIEITAGHRDTTMTYHPGGDYTDEYGQTWTLSGDASLADLTISGNRIRYGKYPDILARLYGAMHSHEGRYIVITAQPGYELIGESSPAHHGGGAHGSLHEKDSLVPVIVTGINSRPKSPRIVDLKAWIMEFTNKQGNPISKTS